MHTQTCKNVRAHTLIFGYVHGKTPLSLITHTYTRYTLHTQTRTRIAKCSDMKRSINQFSKRSDSTLRFRSLGRKAPQEYLQSQMYPAAKITRDDHNNSPRTIFRGFQHLLTHTRIPLASVCTWVMAHGPAAK